MNEFKVCYLRGVQCNYIPAKFLIWGHIGKRVNILGTIRTVHIQ